jgi:hypothetical protein
MTDNALGLAKESLSMFLRMALAATLIVGSLVLVVSAQSTPPADASEAAIAALVSELRAIRVELSETSQRSLRFQLLLARLQLQEQRIVNLDRQRAEVLKTLMDTTTVSAMFTSQFEQLARGCQRASGDDQKECEAQLVTMKATTATHQAREQQLRSQEAELMQAIAAEQGRWSDFSSRLDELERALTRPR